MKHVLVTGATGKIGRRLVPQLAENLGVVVRAYVRNRRKAASLAAAGAELAIGSLEDGGALRTALREIDTLVLITAAGPQAVDQARAALTAARESGVRKVVRVSVFNAASNGPAEVHRLHGRTDAEISSSGLTYTILRPAFFMQNLSLLAAKSIAEQSSIYSGTGAGKISMIDLRDIVDCAEESVLSEAYDNQIFTLTGPEGLTFSEVTVRLSRMMGRTIRHISLSPAAVEHSLRAVGQSGWYARMMRDLSWAYREDWGNVITGDVTHITGRRPRSFQVFAREVLLPTLSLPSRSRNGAASYWDVTRARINELPSFASL